jgi:hypothetical protein
MGANLIILGLIIVSLDTGGEEANGEEEGKGLHRELHITCCAEAATGYNYK